MSGSDRPLAVLIVEDVPDDAELLVRMLREAGYDPEYETVATREEMLEALSRRDFDIVVSDHHVAGFDGLDALRSLRERDRDIPLVLCADLVEEEDAATVLGEGAGASGGRRRMAHTIPAIERELRHAASRRGRHEVERALASEQERSRLLVENSSNLITLMDAEGVLTYVSPAARTLLGYEPEMLREGGLDLVMHPDDLPFVHEHVCRLLTEGHASFAVFEARALGAAGELRTLEWRMTNLLDLPAVGAVLGICDDITDRKRAEQDLHRVNRAMQMLSESNRALVRADDEKALLEDVCRIVVEHGGYQAAWIAPVERGAVLPRPAAFATSGAGRAAAADVGVSEEGLQRFHAALSERAPLVLKERAASGLAGAIGVEEGRSLSIVGLPLPGEPEPLGILGVVLAEPDALDERELGHLAQMAADLAYGMGSLRIREENRRDEEALADSYRAIETAMKETVAAMARVVETRDPYTSGHEERVARLATALAGEMGLTDEEIEVVQLAASIHDVGKVQTPAELLSRPGGLTPLELQLVREHARRGYEIVRTIDLPWPIDDMILQHHERLDGSGYPDGLRQAQIVLGARIIGVADVVEAMSSHRPYRPALGLGSALEFIREGRGVCFDAGVVGACLKVLSVDRGFDFGDGAVRERPPTIDEDRGG